MEQYNVTGMSCAACSSQGGKGSFQSAGCHILFSQPADQFHGSGRNGNLRMRLSRQYRMPDTEHP